VLLNAFLVQLVNNVPLRLHQPFQTAQQINTHLQELLLVQHVQLALTAQIENPNKNALKDTIQLQMRKHVQLVKLDLTVLEELK